MRWIRFTPRAMSSCVFAGDVIYLFSIRTVHTRERTIKTSIDIFFYMNRLKLHCQYLTGCETVQFVIQVEWNVYKSEAPNTKVSCVVICKPAAWAE